MIDVNNLLGGGILIAIGLRSVLYRKKDAQSLERLNKDMWGRSLSARTHEIAFLLGGTVLTIIGAFLAVQSVVGR